MDSTEFELGEICEPLQAHKKDLIFIENLLNTEDSHEDYKGLLTGHKSRGDDKINFVNITESEGMSVDQILARRFGKDTPYSTLHFSYNNKGTGKYDALSFLPGSQPVPAIPDPAQMFDKLFGDFTFGENPEKQAQLGRLRAQRRSILDAALGQISRIKKQVSTLDQSKLDQYFQSLREVEKSLSSEEMTTVGCEKPPFAPPRNGTWFPSEDDDGQAPKILKAQMDMLVLAMSCDLTRYATLRIGHEGTNARYRFLNVERGHHDLSHVEPDKPDAIERYEEITRINRWNAEQLAYLVGKLKSTPAPEGGTLFDSMLIVWVNGLSLGYQHTSRNKPTVLIGSAGGRIRTGRHLRFPTPGNNQPARTYSDMYCALLNKFGISMPRFGDPKYFNGALNELVT